jgi:TolB-like protein/tetratricopeptide (TPR) repeat protein
MLTSRWAFLAGLALPTAAGAQYSYIASPPPCPTPSQALTAHPPSARRGATVGVLALHVQRANADDRYLADAFPDVIARRLAGFERMSLSSPYAVRRLPPATAADARRVARELGTQFLVTGALTTKNGAPRITIVLYDTLMPQPVWRGDYATDSPSLRAASVSVVVAIGTRILGAPTAAEQAMLATPLTQNAAAFQYYLRGLDAAREHAVGHAPRAAQLFRNAVQADPTFAAAHAERASALAVLLDRGTRDAISNPDSVAALAVLEAERATSLDARSARAWSVKGAVLSFVPARRNEVVAAFSTATDLEARDPEIAWLQGRAWLRLGNRVDAEQAFLRATRLAPAFAPALIDLGDLALREQRVVVSCQWLNAAIAADPYDPMAYALRAMARRTEKDVRLAWSDAEIAIRLGARAAGEAAYTLADVTGGDSTRARRLALKLFREFDRRDRIGSRDARVAALALMAVGERARAVSLLERAQPRDGLLGHMLADPAFRPLSADPRFRRIQSDVARRTPEQTVTTRTAP